MTPIIIFALFAALLVKHYVADFVLQPQWMLRDKGNLAAPGGYAHAAFHALSTGALLLIGGVGAAAVAWIVIAEFVLHFSIDYAKDRISAKSCAKTDLLTYWQLHGLDQLLHQLTYVALVFAAALSAHAS